MATAEHTDARLAKLTPQFTILRYFKCGHLPPHLQTTSQRFGELALVTAEAAWARDCNARAEPEIEAYKAHRAAWLAQAGRALEHLLEAKDCAVRAAL